MSREIIHTVDHWAAMVEAKQSGQTFQMDQEVFYYWLEVLPPVYMGQEQEIDGQLRRCAFGFAEGADPVTDFWIQDGRYYGKQRVAVSA